MKHSSDKEDTKLASNSRIHAEDLWMITRVSLLSGDRNTRIHILEYQDKKRGILDNAESISIKRETEMMFHKNVFGGHR